MTLETAHRDLLAPAILSVASAATLIAAWGFQLIGGFVPCALCLAERIPYYIGVPIALAALVAANFGGPMWLKRWLLIALIVVFVYSTYLGVHHAGVEWGFWLGPADCAPGAADPITSAANILEQLEGMRIVSCSEASWRFPVDWGLSFAGWNAATSLFLVAVAAWGATRIKAD